MSYSIDPSRYDLNYVTTRIKTTDLTPSTEPIKQHIDDYIKKLTRIGIKNLDDLHKSMKNKTKLPDLEKESGISGDHLILLRREIEGWFASKMKLEQFSWINKDLANALQKDAICDTEIMYSELSTNSKRQEISQKHSISVDDLEYIYKVANLTRIRWVSPNVARILVDIGYESPEKIANANYIELGKEFAEHNNKAQYFKGKIGDRDIKRLINEAKYVD